MSSTFTYKDDLIERVLNEPKRNVGFYLDSGWPGDNYEVTIPMALTLVSRGWRYGRDLITYVFRAPPTMKQPGACDCIYRCSSSPARSRAPRAALIPF
jgi:hypothetical protein